MTITYQAYFPEGPSMGVIPKEYVATLGGETYKYASPMAGGAQKSRRSRRKTASLRKKRGNPRKSRKSRRSFS